MKDNESPNSRLALILAAGELFAQRGFGAVSTRDIAEKAGVNLGLIHYHFGSKENLHTEALRHAVAKGSARRISEASEAVPERLSDPAELSRIIHRAAQAWFYELLHPDDEPWRIRLLLRELSDPSPGFQVLVREVFHAEHAALVSLYRLVRPHGSDDEAQAWALMPAAHVLLLHQARAPLLMLLGREEFSREFLDSVARTVAAAMVLLVGLPLPEKPEV